MNILEICQDAASLVATQKPRNLFNESSQQDSIFLSITKDTLESLRRYGDWQELTKEGVLCTFPNKKSYLINDFCPDFYSLINDTVYIKDQSERVVGSITAAEFMRDRYFSVPSLDLLFKIQGNRILFTKEPGACYKIVFNYRSAALVYNKDEFDNYIEKVKISKNEDTPIFDEYLVKMGIVWRWNKRNGMPYEEEFNEYEREVKSKFGAGLAVRDINLSGRYFGTDLSGVVINAAKSS